MSAFTTPMPQRTGNPETDINALYAWATAITAELRTMLYSLDAMNIKNVNARSVSGRLEEYQLPESLSRLDITEGSITITASDGTNQAEIYCDSSNNLCINASHGAVYINGIEVI